MTDRLLPAGTLLADRYEVERDIGSGGMATVYVALDRKHNRRVAVKVLRPEIGESVGAERFLREIEIAANLQHPNVLALYDSGEWHGRLFYVMPFIEGESLRERMNRQPAMAVAEISEVTARIALALDYSHARGVVHRDIKPENILLTGGSVVVADFGIARALSAGATPLTVTGLAIGTPAYMSPEQSGGGSETLGASDQYSLACMVYEMLTGETPFGGPTAQAIVLRHWSDPVPRLRARRKDLPVGMEEALVRGMAKDPAERFPSVGEFAAAIGDPAYHTGSALRRGARGPATRRAVLIGAGILGVALLAIGATEIVRRVRRTSAAGTEPVVVVLPFTHTGQAEDRYVADGLTDEITGRIADIRSLRTISSASARQYTNRPLSQIASDLGARYVISGSIATEHLPSGVLRLRVRANLTDLNDVNRQEIVVARLIAEVVAGRLFEVQASVARGVASALSLSLGPDEQRAIDAASTTNPEAYSYYLRAAPLLSFSFEERATRTAIELMQQATRADSTFALAFARLAESQVLYYYFFDRHAPRLALAKQAVDRAIALDPTLPEARVALGFFYYYVVLDLPRANAEFVAVRAEQPNNSELLWIMGALARRAGRFDDAVPLLERAVLLNPRSRLFSLDLEATYLLMRAYASADREAQRCIALDSTWFASWLQASIIPQLWHGDLAARRQRLREAMAHSGPSAVLQWMTNNDRWGLVTAGPEFQSMLESLNIASLRIDSGAYYVAIAQWRRGQRDTVAERAAASRARVLLQRTIRESPDNPAPHGALGVADAMLGLHDEAIREGMKGVQLLPTSRDAFRGPTQEQALLEIYLLLGERDAAVQLTRRLLALPSDLSVPYVRADPHFDGIRATPAFQALLKEGGTSD